MIPTTEKMIGDADFHVFMAQCALAWHNYHFGYNFDEIGALRKLGIDGIFGTRSKLAVECFQRDHDLEVTGTVNYATMYELFRDYNLVVDE